MRLLLDTHAFLWFVTGESKLVRTARRRIEITEDTFVPRSDVEREAMDRIRYWVAAAEKLLDDPDVPAEQKESCAGSSPIPGTH